jgi:hypothetical protein
LRGLQTPYLGTSSPLLPRRMTQACALKPP